MLDIYIGTYTTTGADIIGDVTIDNNAITENGYWTSSSDKYSEWSTGDIEAMGIQNPSGMIIQNNMITNSQTGITFWGHSSLTSMSETVRYNYIHNIENFGVVISGLKVQSIQVCLENNTDI